MISLLNFPMCIDARSVKKRGIEKQMNSRVVEKNSDQPQPSARNQDLAKRFAWEVASINVHLQQLRHFWAKTLGVSGPQWMILMALADLDKGDGVPVKVVSKMLHVDSSFVTTQSKMLEKKGFMRRKTSEDDGRVVKMSLTDKSYKHIANLASQQEALNKFIFAEFSDRELTEFTGKLASLKDQFEKACLKVAMDI
ncbi:DNA-binding MarR family transcriptional regulator [Bradyrhizobium sp. AZCC 1678]